jgi:hypothetical protein
MQVSNHKQLHPAKRLPEVAVSPQHLVNGVQQVCPDHAHLVNDQEVYALDQIHLGAVEAPESVVFPGGTRQLGAKWQLKKGVNGHAACIDGRDPCGRHHYHSLLAFLLDLVQKGGFSSSGLASEKNMAVRVAHKFKGQVDLGIGDFLHADFLLIVKKSSFSQI